MIALVGALLITIALAAPLALTLEDFDMFRAKFVGPTCAQLAQFGVGTKTAGVFIGECKWRSATRRPGNLTVARARVACARVARGRPEQKHDARLL